jgi:hypothetical protein
MQWKKTLITILGAVFAVTALAAFTTQRAPFDARAA